MADSPITNSAGVTTFTISANGKIIDSKIEIISLQVMSQINQIASAQLVIRDGNMAKQSFDCSDADTFMPGSRIIISAGYANNDEVIFEGIVIKHAIRISGNNQSTLNITCQDQSVAMTIARKSESFLNQSDSDVISNLITRYSAINIEKIETISEKHHELVQFNCTDWDFLLTRAEANGMVVCNQFNRLTVAPPSVDIAPSLVITYGTDLIDFSAEIDAKNQFNQITAMGWDPNQQQTVKGQAAAASIANQGNLSSNDLASVLHLADYHLQTSSNLSQGMLSSWAKGQSIKSMLSKIRGAVTFTGSANAKINTLLQLSGVGERFNGSHYISGVHHQIEHGQWLTTVDLGMSAIWSSEHRDLGAPAAAGWIPPVDGLQIGRVSQLDKDPKSQCRIQVEIPAMGAENNLIWARLCSYYATHQSGNFFIPELGDEVILGYINQDPGQAVIIGSVYSAKHVTPYPLSAENNTKAIVSKSQLKVEFNDKDKIITIVTPAQQSITLDDTNKTIVVEDQHKNTISMNSSGITLSSHKDITLSAKGEISLQSGRNTGITAKGDINVDGLNVNIKAQINFSAKSAASAELSSSGQTVIKGGIVLIN